MYVCMYYWADPEGGPGDQDPAFAVNFYFWGILYFFKKDVKLVDLRGKLSKKFPRRPPPLQTLWIRPCAHAFQRTLYFMSGSSFGPGESI